jgi:hypothetical protein
MKRPHWYSEHELSLIFLHKILLRRSSMAAAFCFLFSLGSVWQEAPPLFRQRAPRDNVFYVPQGDARGRQSHFTPACLPRPVSVRALNRPLAGCQKRAADAASEKHKTHSHTYRA